MARTFVDIKYGEKRPADEVERGQPTHTQKVIPAGSTFKRSDLGNEVDDETWGLWLSQGIVSAGDEDEAPPPVVGEATAGRDYGEPLTDAEIASIGQPGTHPGSAPARPAPPGDAGTLASGPAPKPVAMQHATEERAAEESKAAEVKKATTTTTTKKAE